MRRNVLTLLFLVGITAFAAPALAGKATTSGGGPLTATISVAGNAAEPYPASTPLSFNVTRTVVDDTVYWVYNYCWDASGNLLSTEAYPVLWPSWDSLTGGTYPYVFKLSGTHCEALVTVKPWTAQPLKGAVVDYTVG